jgi:hypothetical protein
MISRFLSSILASTAVAALSLGTSACSSSSSGGTTSGATITYGATLDGAHETPAVTTTATGMATFTLSADKATLSYHITQNVMGASAAHIHTGVLGQAGAVVYPITPVSADMTGTISLTHATDVPSLDGAMFYVNIHSPANPNGEIRGQISKQ